ncbi:MAG: hypothetical protein JW800_06845 [Candidatus Omnitrophica bacterium]|nr:hypothetical protein [Candidatus Omnitrophota bacterium]
MNLDNKFERGIETKIAGPEDNISVHIDSRHDRKVNTGSLNKRQAWVFGQIFSSGFFHDAESLTSQILRMREFSPGAFKNLISAFNGNFAIIVKDRDRCFVAVDRLRSVPLFYTRKNGTLRISNSARSLRGYLGEEGIDPLSSYEFYRAGYVTGSDTLFKDIKQLRAGEYLYSEGNVKQINVERYYEYWPRHISDSPEAVLLKELDAVLVRTFGRLCSGAEGRTLAVPLSGGLDSRVVGTMLKRLDYKDVICFSYGRKGNAESRKSKEVADALGFRWFFIEYTPSKWKGWKRSKEFQDYFKYADNFASLAHIDDWAAVWELKIGGAVPEDAIFVPGHTGDFISGGHLRYVYGAKEEINEDDLMERILEKHYGLWPVNSQDNKLNIILLEKLKAQLSEFEYITQQALASWYELWEWQERQAKFIVNSVRAYEFWGYDWRIPLWDNELMDFWCSVPYTYKLDKRLYRAYLTAKNAYGVFASTTNTTLHNRFMSHVAERRYSLIGKPVFDLYRAYRRLNDYARGAKATYGMYSYADFLLNFRGIRNPNSLLVKEYLDGLRAGGPALKDNNQFKEG